MVVSNENLGVSHKILRVSNENLGVSKENPGGLQRKSWVSNKFDKAETAYLGKWAVSLKQKPPIFRNDRFLQVKTILPRNGRSL